MSKITALAAGAVLAAAAALPVIAAPAQAASAECKLTGHLVLRANATASAVAVCSNVTHVSLTATLFRDQEQTSATVTRAVIKSSTTVSTSVSNVCDPKDSYKAVARISFVVGDTTVTHTISTPVEHNPSCRG